MDLRLLCNLKFTLSDKVDSINNRFIFWINFLASQEGLYFHVVLDLFNHVSPKLAKHSESPKELNFLLQLSFLGEADDLVVVTTMECRKSCLFAAHDSSCAVFVL